MFYFTTVIDPCQSSDTCGDNGTCEAADPFTCECEVGFCGSNCSVCKYDMSVNTSDLKIDIFEKSLHF